MKTMHVLTGWSVLLLGLSFNPNILADELDGAPAASGDHCSDGKCSEPDTAGPAAAGNKETAVSENTTESRPVVSEQDVQQSKDVLIDEIYRVSKALANCKDGGVNEFQTFLAEMGLYLLKDVKSPITDEVQTKIKQYNIAVDRVLEEREEKAKDKKAAVKDGFKDLKKKFSEFSTRIGIKIEDKDRTAFKKSDHPTAWGAFENIKESDEACVIKAAEKIVPPGDQKPGGAPGSLPPVGPAKPEKPADPKKPTDEDINAKIEEYMKPREEFLRQEWEKMKKEKEDQNRKLDEIAQKLHEPKKETTEPAPHKQDRSGDDLAKLLPALLDQGKGSPAPSTGGGGSAPPGGGMPQSQPQPQNDNKPQLPFDPAALAALQGGGANNPMAALLPALLSGMFGGGNTTPTQTTGSGIEVGSRFNPETMDLRRNLDDLNSKFAQTNARLNDVARNSTQPPFFGPQQSPQWDPRFANFGGQPIGPPNYGNAPWSYPGARNPRTVLTSLNSQNRPPFGTFGSRASKPPYGLSATSGTQGSGFISRRPDGRVTDSLANTIRKNSSRWTQNIS